MMILWNLSPYVSFKIEMFIIYLEGQNQNLLWSSLSSTLYTNAGTELCSNRWLCSQLPCDYYILCSKIKTSLTWSSVSNDIYFIIKWIQASGKQLYFPHFLANIIAVCGSLCNSELHVISTYCSKEFGDSNYWRKGYCGFP